MSEVAVQAELDIFASSDSAAEQSRALSALMKLKKLHQAAKKPNFHRGLDKLLQAAGERTGASERLTALAALSRVGSLVKPLHQRISLALPSVLVIPPEELQFVDDPDDRYYIASLWRQTKTPWLSQYLAKGAVDEEGSDRVRSECLEGLLDVNADLATALGELSVPMRRLSFSTEKPGDSKARRLRRILESLRTVYAASTKEPGENAGEKFKTFLVDSFVHDGLPTNPSLLDEVAEESLGVVHQIIKARFSLATSTETYSALDVVKGWYRDIAWTDFAEQSIAAALLVRDLTAALEMLLRAGVSDEGLFSRLTVAAGGQNSARAVAKDLLNRLPGLPEDLAQWLSGLPPRRRSALAAESQLLGFDEGLGDLIINAQRLRELADRVRNDALPEIGVMSPRAAFPVEGLLGVVRSTVNSLDAVAKIRDLSIKGSVGDIVEFSPFEHEMVGGARPGVRMARMVRPAVEAPGVGGGRRVLRKALVEPAE